jgi:hypothetical protein
MQNLKKPTLLLLCAALGAGYLGLFSTVEMPGMLEGFVVLLPVQVGVLVYLLGFRRSANRALDGRGSERDG